MRRGLAAERTHQLQQGQWEGVSPEVTSNQTRKTSSYDHDITRTMMLPDHQVASFGNPTSDSHSPFDREGNSSATSLR
ncbi:hypothetical protein JTE90_005207 [Oedothorax gibbosus]|uniref:Uncharacterized protein n=1 Tax=Oedothorax gibbosus TaxID=931172 RepID=A0AAV6ULD5_9ARAC|nr:hypothetical protein JTE90_005207 [Oedothorax gibbosus]